MPTRTAAKTATRTPAKERLSRAAVARAALALADAEGIEALTIRRLATGLGVTPMALYWHFKDKDALLDGLAEHLFAEVTLPADDPDGDWAEQLRQVFDALLAALARHPAVALVVKSRILGNDPGRDVSERILGLLRRGGFSVDRAAQVGVYALITMACIVADEPGLEVGVSDDERDAAVRGRWAALQALSPKRYPNIVDSAESLTDCAASDQWLELGLDTLMAGIRAQAPR
ncbi:TetR/AcrR family transcriptional regulator C-terminal domain-containing protein [Nocardioides sp. C4-1]|uniref:TetR/AcrR family transcriptional regulator C-terminal domain-containing protein n=1 Tax=Nocardioides sp. C4-1 TaxID=3151851 RepID=UPI003267884B